MRSTGKVVIGVAAVACAACASSGGSPRPAPARGPTAASPEPRKEPASVPGRSTDEPNGGARPEPPAPDAPFPTAVAGLPLEASAEAVGSACAAAGGTPTLVETSVLCDVLPVEPFPGRETGPAIVKFCPDASGTPSSCEIALVLRNERGDRATFERLFRQKYGAPSAVTRPVEFSCSGRPGWRAAWVWKEPVAALMLTFGCGTNGPIAAAHYRTRRALQEAVEEFQERRGNF